LPTRCTVDQPRNNARLEQLDCRSRALTKRCVMTTLQAICLGAMLAWTPSLVVLAWLLREVDEF
jgi:hypothetical protein